MVPLPNLIKHATVAIFREGGITAKTQKDKFRQALLIARSRMAQYGFVILGGEKVTDPLHLTPKGKKREQKHRREGRAKSVLFDTLYEKYDIDGSKARAKKELEKAAERALEASPSGDERKS